MSTRHPGWDELRERLPRRQAILVADSRRPAPGLRGIGRARARTLRYEAGNLIIAFSLRPGEEPETWDIIGQVVPREGCELPRSAWAAALGAGEIIDTPISDLGEFALRGVRPESGEMGILIGEVLVRLQLPTD